MIGTRTPFRISFIGGGSDVEEFYSKSTGAVISTTINKYMYIFVHQYFDERLQIKYSKTELVNKVQDIKHPIAREALAKFKMTGIDINSIADVPAGTGLGSSSSYSVCLLHALYSYNNIHVSSEQLAREACELEIDILKEPIGKQDQYAAAYGGLNMIRFFNNGHVDVEPIIMDPIAISRLQKNLLLFYIGGIRKASDILIDQKKNLLDDNEKLNTVKEMVSLVPVLKKCLIEEDFDKFGRVLDINWQLKKSLSKKISTTEIDDIYNLGLKCGATGGKILGAGGGGFILFYCEEMYHQKLRDALKNLKELRFSFDQTGSKVIYVGDIFKDTIWK